MKKQLVICCGTGRCGTVSLGVLLNEQENSEFTHEMRPILPWFPISESMIEERIKILLDRNADFVGESAGYYVRYVPTIIEKHPSAKIIVIERNKWDVVKSFLKHSVGRNNWQDSMESEGDFTICTPKYSAKLSKMDAIAKYVDDIQEETRIYQDKYPNNVKIFNMEDLNTRKGIINILGFCGYKKMLMFHPHLNKYIQR